MSRRTPKTLDIGVAACPVEGGNMWFKPLLDPLEASFKTGNRLGPIQFDVKTPPTVSLSRKEVITEKVHDWIWFKNRRKSVTDPGARLVSVSGFRKLKIRQRQTLARELRRSREPSHTSTRTRESRSV